MRVYTYIMIMTGMMVLLTFFGFTTGSNLILTSTGLLDNPQNFQSSLLYSKLSSLLLLATGAAIIIGLYTKQNSESYLVIGMTTLLASFIMDMVSILNEVNVSSGGTTNWIYMVAAFFVIPFSVGYIISVVEWWRGSD